MDGLVGETRYPKFAPLVGGLPVLGATGTYQLTGPAPAGPPSVTVLTEGPPGTYSPGVLPGATWWTLPGAYAEVWVLTQGAYTWHREITVVLAPYAAGMVTLRELRHRCAEECRDQWTGVATGGAALELVDTERWEPDHHFKGYELHVYAGGAAAGLTRRVTESLAGGRLQWATTAAPAPAAGDYYELHRRYTVTAYNRALNRALDSVRELVLQDMTDEATYPVGDTWEYPLPAEMTHLQMVYWRPVTGVAPNQAPSGNWRPLDYGAGDWELAPGRRLRLRHPLRDSQLRLVGQAALPTLAEDDALLAGPTEYVVWRAAATLTAQRLSAGAMDAEGAKELLTYLETRATHGLIEPRSRSRPNGRRIT